MAKGADTRNTITATQLLLHTLREAGEPLTVHELMERARRIAERLKQAGLGIAVFFRGPYCGNVWSEQVERSLWYWLSNGFVQQEKETPGRRLSLSASGQGLFNDKNLSAAIHRNLDKETLALFTATAKSSVS